MLSNVNHRTNEHEKYTGKCPPKGLLKEPISTEMGFKWCQTRAKSVLKPCKERQPAIHLWKASMVTVWSVNGRMTTQIYSVDIVRAESNCQIISLWVTHYNVLMTESDWPVVKSHCLAINTSCINLVFLLCWGCIEVVFWGIQVVSICLNVLCDSLIKRVSGLFWLSGPLVKRLARPTNHN